MEKINSTADVQPHSLEEAVVLESKQRKKLAKGFMNSAGIVIGIFIVFVAVVVMTTDVHVVSLLDVAEIGLSFFILLFCSYSMYVSCADSGMRAGLVTDTYTGVECAYETTKKYIIENKMQYRLPEFCRYYSEEELMNTRNGILAEVGILYETYHKKYIGKDDITIKTDSKLSEAQQNAIIKANSIKPIKLTPEMIMKRGRGSDQRNPLGVKPENLKMRRFITKFVQTCLTSTFMASIALDMVSEPTWNMFASVALKTLSIVLNGFMGYKFGFENIVVDTVHYTNDQIDLMEQHKQFVANHPNPLYLLPSDMSEEDDDDDSATLSEIKAKKKASSVFGREATLEELLNVEYVETGDGTHYRRYTKGDEKSADVKNSEKEKAKA